MPQLWTETIVTQYFWLVVILFGFYFIAVVKFIPQVAFTLKARRALEAAGLDLKKAVSADKNSTDSLHSTQALLTTIITPRIPQYKADTVTLELNKILLSATRVNWIKKYSV